MTQNLVLHEELTETPAQGCRLPNCTIQTIREKTVIGGIIRIVKYMGKHRKWFWISGLYDNKRDILLNGMILSGTHSINLVGSAHTAVEQL